MQDMEMKETYPRRKKRRDERAEGHRIAMKNAKALEQPGGQDINEQAQALAMQRRKDSAR